ncbi:MAG: amino acid adenylation domain-containing protein, partial [Nitrospirae bacterium]|nr:amino acid adenylation domain-containing protein [Nitrospirota bacterium]
ARPAKKVNFRSMNLQASNDMTPPQKDFINRFIARYINKTGKSREMTQRYRPVLADWINTLGFRYSLKELVYPLVSQSSKGSRFLDIDGNEYIDIAMGKGVNFFGHSPDFITEAIGRQMADGFELSPQTRLAGEVAELISELTGVERVTFSNTGSEAVMVALRIARTVTGRNKIALFSGAYHGISDGVLATSDDEHTYPTAPGIMQGMVDDVIVLNYGTPAALDAIKAEGQGLAAILVETVQSRRPGFQPREFLHQLRQVASEIGALLIFDEIITGFRIHPGGVQSLFGVQADIVTYGKVIGGGMPISVVAGKAHCMDAIDGGMWQYGDNSYPEKEMTLFGGTYCRHPLALAATKAVLLYMKEHGPSLQEDVNSRTARMAAELNKFFETENVPVRMAHFGSLFRFESFGKYSLMLQPIEMDLLFYILIEKGVYTWERRICFMSAAHTDEDVDYIIRAFKESVKELREGGFPFEGAGPAGAVTCPMTSAQERMYVLSSMDGGERGYHLAGAFVVDGALDAQKVEDSFREIIRRHEALRTGFEIRENALVMKIYPDVNFNLDILEGEEKNIDDIIERLIKPFDLANPPLLRVSLVRFSPTRHMLFIDAHHIAADGLSMSIIVSEFGYLYEEKKLVPVTKHYRDYQAHEISHINSDEFKKHESFWLSEFSGELPVLNLPADFPRPVVQDFAGSNLHFVIDEVMTADLKLLAKKTGSSIFMILLSSYYVLLYKLTGQNDLIVGLPVGGRPAKDFDDTVGMFANTLAVRNILSPEMKFSEFVRGMKKKLLSAYDCGDYPFGSLVEKLNLQKDVSRNPLFDTMFIFENADSRVLKIRDLVFTARNVDPGTSMFDLALEAIEAEARLNMRFEYSTGLFSSDTIMRYRSYFEKLLREVLLDYDLPLSGINIVPDSERHKLIVEFNDTVMAYHDKKTIVDLFEEQVALSPERTAVVFGNKSLTFRELNETADALASYLLDFHAVKPGDLVGLMVDRSEMMLAGMLGILKSGAAYVPVDPSYPEERISYIINNSKCAVVLTENKYIRAASLNNNPEVKAADIAAAKKAVTSKPHGAISGSSLAYVMYTSGSTGKPKGVMIEHRNVVSFSLNLPHKFGFSPDDTILGLTTFTFDISVLELICSLLNGMKVVIASEEECMEPELILDLIRNNRITVMQATPSRMKLLVTAVNKRLLNGVRTLLIGGEGLPEGLCEDLKQYAIGDIFNVYGPTETTIWSTTQRLDGLHSGIGRPLLNEGVIILAGDSSLMPLGCIGEICIYGDGVGRGYLNMPDLTAEKFVDDAAISNRIFSGTAVLNSRFYRTGDLGRRSTDGSIEFLGRKDHQIKVRGFRVELGEIEYALMRHPGIRAAVVDVKRLNGADSENELVAFIEGDTELTASHLKDYLRQTLPDYMIPSFFVPVERMPLMSSGKINRKALPHLPNMGDATKIAAGVDHKTSGNELEKKLVKVWESVLSRRGIGITDNFFDLGGDSIKAVQIISRLNGEGLKLKVTDIFRYPTVAELSQRVGSNGGSNASCISGHINCPLSVPQGIDEFLVRNGIDRGGLKDIYPLSPLQEGMLYHRISDDKSTAYLEQISFTIEGGLDISAFRKSWNELFKRHDIFRTIFVYKETEEPFQIVFRERAADFRFEDLSSYTRPEQEGYIERQKRMVFENGFDLSKDVLMQVTVLKVGDASFKLIWSYHHIVMDGWCLGIVLKELFESYKALRDGAAIQMSDAGQYGTYIRWLKSFDTKAAQAYWRNYLDGYERATTLIGKSKAEGHVITPGVYNFSLEVERSWKLSLVASIHQVTINIILQNIWAVLLAKYSGSDDVVFGVTVSGRPDDIPGVERIAGLFINTVPVRVRIHGDDTFDELIKRTQTEALLSVPYHYLSLPEIQVLSPLKNRLFDHLIIFENYPLSDELHELHEKMQVGFSISDIEVYEQTNYDLAVLIHPKKDIGFEFRYNSNVYSSEQLERIRTDIINLVDAVSADPDISLERLKKSLTSSEEREEGNRFLDSIMEIGEEF